MKSILFWVLLAIVLCTVRGHAANKDVAPAKDVDEAAKREVARRGSFVELTGTVRSDTVAMALRPPADDDWKWFVTLVGTPGDAKYDAMRTMLRQNKEPALLAWIDINDPANSYTHFQDRVWDLKGTQKDWLAPLIPAVERYGLPLLVIQPPRNGKFGDPATVVKCFHGIVKAEDLAPKIRDGVIAYCRAIDNPVVVGVRDATIGVPPPFNVPGPVPQVQPPNNQPPFEWPQTTPATLSIDQIRAACPGASPKFILEIKRDKETDLETVKLRWLIAQQETPVTPVPPELLPIPDPQPQVVLPRVFPVEPKEPPSFCLPALSTRWETLVTLLIGLAAGRLMGPMEKWVAKIGDIGRARNESTIATLRRTQTMLDQMRASIETNQSTDTPSDGNSPPKTVATVNMNGVPPARPV